MQRLEIKKFGPIEKVEIFVKDYLVFIGPQASGKSTISKAIFFFKSLRDDLMRYVLESIDNEKIKDPLGAYLKNIKKKFIDFWGTTFHLDNIYICYSFKDDIWIEITLEENQKYINLKFSHNFLSTFNDIIFHAKDFLAKKDRRNSTFLSSKDLIQIASEKRTFTKQLETMVNDLFDEDKDLLFIPAGRSLLSTLSDQLQYIHTHRLDYLMRSFVDRINATKHIFNKGLRELVKEREELFIEKIDFEKVDFTIDLIEQILKGEYRCDKEGEKIYFDSERYIKINYSSSGQQESIWILLLIFLLVLENRSVFIVIEEPEAHLYPEAQKIMVDAISLLSNLKNNQIIITTHSPYILASINNLMYANKVGKKERSKVKEKIHPYLWLDANKVGAFSIDKGKIHNIVDENLESIATEAIDTASTIINNDYEYLFEIE